MMADSNLELIEALKQVLTELPGWSDVQFEESNDADYRVQAKVRGKRIQFRLEVKSGTWRPEALDRIQNQSLNSNEPIVIATGWIPPKLAKSLREEKGLNYLDTAGNAYLDFPGLQVFRETNGLPAVDPVRKRPPGGAFNASAVRVGLQFLLDPLLVGSNLRAIGALAGVSAPSAKFALDTFKVGGYVIEISKKVRRLVEREAFLRKWAESYNRNYRPKYAMGRYSAGSEAMVLDGFDACWGGEPAADYLTHNLKPVGKVVYCYSRKIGPLVAKNRLRPDPQGTVELVNACWEIREQEPQGTAPAFVVFADLLDTRDPRCIEVAEQIFETILKKRFLANGQ